MLGHEIHLWDLPVNQVYIRLKDTFGKEFFDKARKMAGSWNDLGKMLDVKRGDTTIARNWRYGNCCFPLCIGLEICKLTKISTSRLEKSLLEIKCKSRLNERGGNNGKPISNPKFPICVDEDFCEILGHVCGDGTIVKSVNKGITLGYINSEPKLIGEFKRKICDVFGEIEPNIQIRNEKPRYRRPNYYIRYPAILAMIVLSVFDCKTKDKKDVPLFIHDVPTTHKCKFLRALFDDKGTISVDRKRISIGVKPKSFILNIRKLLRDVGFRTSKIYDGPNCRYIEIAGKKNTLLFKELIGFKHPAKSKKLSDVINVGWCFDRCYNGEAHQKITDFLKKNKRASTELIAKSTGLSPRTAYAHLRKLKNKELITSSKMCVRRQNNIVFNVWRLNET